MTRSEKEEHVALSTNIGENICLDVSEKKWKATILLFSNYPGHGHSARHKRRPRKSSHMKKLTS